MPQSDAWRGLTGSDLLAALVSADDIEDPNLISPATTIANSALIRAGRQLTTIPSPPSPPPPLTAPLE